MSGAPAPLSGSSRPLTELYDVALLDLDGVVYIGPDPVTGAPQHLERAVAGGMRIGYITNNASRTPDSVAQHLRSFGIPVTGEDVVTSAQAVAELLAKEFPAGSPVLVVGGEGLHDALEEHGMLLVRGSADRPVAVVQGFAPDVSWRMLSEGAYAINAGAKWFASNLDLTIPTQYGRAPGNGALVKAVREAVDVDPVVAGKPAPPLLRTSIERLRAERPLMVGDRLDTDVAGAYAVGIPSLWVGTGVNSPADLVDAPPEQRPTYVGPGLGALTETHPEVDSDGGRYRCRGWETVVENGTVRLSGQGIPYDGLRAVLVAAWAADEQDDERVDASEALTALGFRSGPRKS